MYRWGESGRVSVCEEVLQRGRRAAELICSLIIFSGALRGGPLAVLEGTRSIDRWPQDPLLASQGPRLNERKKESPYFSRERIKAAASAAMCGTERISESISDRAGDLVYELFRKKNKKKTGTACVGWNFSIPHGPSEKRDFIRIQPKPWAITKPGRCSNSQQLAKLIKAEPRFSSRTLSCTRAVMRPDDVLSEGSSAAELFDWGY